MGFAKRSIAGLAIVAVGVCSYADFDGAAPVAWRFIEATRAAPGGVPVEKDGIVYIGLGGRIYALDKATGNLKWRYPSGEPLQANFRSGVVLSGDKVIAANDNRVMVAVNAASGDLAWQYNGADLISGTPVISQNYIIVPTVNSLMAVNLADGTQAWTNPYSYKDGLNGRLAVWNNLVMFTTVDSKLVAVDVTTQKEKWSKSFGRLSGTAAPVVYGESVYVNSSNYIVSLRAFTGGVRWQKTVPDSLVYSPAVSENGVVAVTMSGKAFAFDLNGRQVNRQAGDFKSNPAASPAFVGKYVAMPLADGSLVMMDHLTGDIVWIYTFPTVMTSGSSSSAGGGAGAAGAGAAGAGAAPGAGAGGGGASEGPKEVNLVGVSSAAMAGNTLLMLTNDGSLFAFDKELGVDLTPPSASMIWPNPGDQVSPSPPAEFVFKLEDYGSGIDPDSVKCTVNGKEQVITYDKTTALLRILIINGGKNPAFAIGRAEFEVTAADWMGNESKTKFAVTVDPQVTRPLGAPPRSGGDTGGTSGGPGAGPGTGGGRGGGGRGGR